MSQQFLLPDLGEGLTEAEIVSWLVAPGDTVSIDQPVVEVESAKSVVELPCPFTGIVESLHVAVGQTVHAGQPLLTVANAASAEPPRHANADRGETTGAAVADTGELVPGTALREPQPAAAAESGAVLVGYGTQERARRAGPTPVGRFGARTTAVSRVPAAALPGPSPVVSPLVRKLAREHGFTASELIGSGQNSLVLRTDVDSHIARLNADTGTPSTTPSGDQRIPISGVRQLIADRLSTSRREIPEATIWLDVDATALLAAKDSLQRSTGEKFSVTTLIARFVVAGLKRYPILNSSVDMAAGEIVQHGTINLGLAAQTPRGLMVPVVHDAGALTTVRLRDRITGLISTAAEGSFSPGQLTGGTFTLNNYGGFGVDGSAAIINYPEVAILGFGRIIDRPWVVDGHIVVRKVVVLSLVFDHRVCDGDVPSAFIGFVARCIENPISLLGDL